MQGRQAGSLQANKGSVNKGVENGLCFQDAAIAGICQFSESESKRKLPVFPSQGRNH